MALAITVCLSNVACALIAGGLAVPLVRRRVKMNGYYGVRFARSFESDELWYRINEYGGRRLLLWSIPILALGLVALFVSSEAWLVTLAFAPMLYIIPCIESYVFARRL